VTKLISLHVMQKIHSQKHIHGSFWRLWTLLPCSSDPLTCL